MEAQKRTGSSAVGTGEGLGVRRRYNFWLYKTQEWSLQDKQDTFV